MSDGPEPHLSGEIPTVNGGAATSMEEQFRDKLVELNVAGLRLAALLGAVLYPLFIVLDHFVIPEYTGPLTVLRLVVVFYSLGLIALSRTDLGRRYVVPLTVSITAAFGLTIAFMVHLHDLATGAGPSPYYAGLNLVFIAAGLLFSWPRRLAVPTFAVMYLAYLVPSLLLGNLADVPTFLAANFFLVSTVAVVTEAQAHALRLQRREFDAAFQLRLMDQVKTSFFSNITHELKTPLTLILSPIESILRGELGQFDDGQREYLQGIHRNGIRLMRLINDLLDLSKLEGANIRLRVEETDLGEFAGSMVDSGAPLAERKALRVVLDVDGDSPMAWVDHHRFERVMLNLLANATKFTAEGGTITVGVQGRADTVVVSVHDTGIGIPADKLDFVFDRFSQVDASGTRRYGGTGIGLALARELVELHGGRIEADSEEGEWTLMTVTLRRGADHFGDGVLDRRQRTEEVVAGKRAEDRGPKEWAVQLEQSEEYRQLEVADATERRRVPRTAPSPTRTHRVLVVEDNHELLELLHTQLQERFDVYVAEDGSRGLELACRVLPDLVLTDRMMPVMDGVELCRRLKSDDATAHIPVVMLTAKARVEDRIEGRQAGADAYLAKPFSPAELLHVLHRLLQTGDLRTETAAERELDASTLLASRMAHELGNPLGAIRGGVGVLERAVDELVELARGGGDLGEEERRQRLHKLSARVQRMTAMVLDGVGRAGGMVDQLRDYSREAYARSQQPHPVDDAVVAAVDMLMLPEGSGVRVESQLECECRVECVPEELHAVVFNLLQNAVDALGGADDGRGTIEVTTAAADGWATVTVSDDGPGMEVEVSQRVFSPFFSSKEGLGGSMGLGLTIVRQLVRGMNGDVTVRSEPGAGATFEVTLPVTHGESA